MKEYVSRATRFVALTAALALALGASATAEAGSKPEKKQKPRQVHPTGEEDAKAPTAAELQSEAALEQMTNRSAEGLTVVQHENGMASMDLEGRFMSVMVAVPRKDGSKGGECVDSHAKVVKARAAAARTPQAGAVPAPPPNVAPVLEEK